MKKSKLATILGALTLTAGIAVAGSGSADAALGDRHFILITSKGAPLWKGDAQVYDGQKTLVANFKQTLRSGGRVKWEFTDPGPGGKINYKIGDDANQLVGELDTDRDHCFLETAGGGSPKYTGDSLKGGCTPD
jgi:hypothetical protein